MVTLTDFLLARIAEDEHLALLADAVTDKVEGDWQDVTQPITHATTQARPPEPWSKKYGHAYGHIARHDPARVLAECEAKRRIVAAHTAWDENDWQSPAYFSAPMDEVLALLALPYADHPDYREEWRP